MRPTRTATALSLALAAAFAAACSDVGNGDTRSPTSPTVSPVVVEQDFAFLAPIGEDDPFLDGDLNAAANPVVQICRLTGSFCAGTIATFTRTSGGMYALRIEEGNGGVNVLDASVDHFVAQWNTQRFALNPATDYRVRVMLNNREIASANVDILGHSSQSPKEGYVGVVNGQTLDIRFFLGAFGGVD